jgi:ubiquitin conjugation factor E4 A
VNLLINDAIFLLDEALSNLMQIKQLQSAQDNGEWNDLPEAERRQNQTNLQHLGMLAKFDNILGRDTINLLTILTAETKRIFCHSTMVDRVANFLNYFLLHLVGPKKGDYKVKDKKEYEFDPKTTVLHITQIYINMENCEEFCLAVSQDGRSYSPQLFDFAIEVLGEHETSILSRMCFIESLKTARIGGGALMTDLKEFSEKVQRLEKQKQEDDEVRKYYHNFENCKQLFALRF